MSKLSVCYTTDHTYFYPMLVSIYSLLENNQKLEINLYILYDGFTLEEQLKLDEVVSHFSNVQLYIYDAVPLYSKMYSFNIPDWRGTKIANMRLFLADIIPNCPDSLLYLDSDTIVVGDLSEALTQNKTQPIAAVYDHSSKSYWQNLSSSLKHYYNSGVLQFDYNLYEKNNWYRQIEKVLEEGYLLTYPDQDILNLSFQDQIATLPPAYNLFPTDLYYDIHTLQKYYKSIEVEFYEKEELLQAKRFPKILHAALFYGVRTWQNNRIHPFQDLYLEYLIKCCGIDYELEESSIPCANVNPYLFKLFNYARIYTPKEVRQGLKRILVKSNKDFKK